MNGFIFIQVGFYLIAEMCFRWVLNIKWMLCNASKNIYGYIIQCILYSVILMIPKIVYKTK